LLVKAKTSVDQKLRNQYLDQIQRTVWEYSPYIWLYAQNNVSAVRADVTTVDVLPVVFTLVHGDK